jgi:hypothetical protein
MKYQSVLFILLLAALITVPASANLKKIDAGVPVFLGETGLDISSALNGCRQIAWWDEGNSTDNAPLKVIDIGENIHSYNITPEMYSQYTGKWYSYDKKPSVVVFEVIRPEFDVRVWDADRDVDITGQTVPSSTRITYRVDTNMVPVLNKYNRPDVNNLDSFMTVTLTGPNGKEIKNIYTMSAGNPEAVSLAYYPAIRVKESPYYWSDGPKWNRSAKSGDGALLNPPGTYTFVGSQNLNGMQMYYNATDPEITTGTRTITFVPDETGADTGTPTLTTTTQTVPSSTISETMKTTTKPAGTTTAVKSTWTSTPLPPEIALLALSIALACFCRGMQSRRK